MKLLHGDCLDVLKELPDNSVDAVVTDPPYGLKFMGKKWDYDVPSVEVWRECLRVLKPGGHLLSFAGSRTYHRMTCAIEDAGFEVRDQIMWVYGCLDEATEVATANGVMPYHKTKIGDIVLCYNSSNGEYSYQPILEIVEYEYSDTAYRLIGDFGEQIVSRNHRVIVERDGSEAFMLAETLECEARVPILEDLPALQQAIHDAHAGAGCAKQDMRASVLGGADWDEKRRSRLIGGPQGPDDNVRGMFKDCLEAGRLAAQGDDTDMQPKVQWGATRCGVGKTCSQGTGALVGRVEGGTFAAHDGAGESSMERRSNVSESERCICEPADQVRSLPCGVPEHGAEGRVCNGAPSACGASDCATVDQTRGSASHQPQGDGQPAIEPDAVCHERAAQGVRAWRGHRSAVVRVVPFHYTGKVWCLRVPTGAFVAVRNGVAFPTGNSGFPKSLDVSKALDDKLGGVRNTVKVKPRAETSGTMAGASDTRPWIEKPRELGYHEVADKNPVTDAARQWQGWGTALKPAHEPICVARKPFTGTVAANVLKHGTGALNVDGCRVGDDVLPAQVRVVTRMGTFEGADGNETPERVGRFPANLIHDGISEPWARYFYCAKASRKERDEGLDGFELRVAGGLSGRADGSLGSVSLGRNTHPTVKPTDLMRYLVRLVTPPGGVVLDPFMGSGSTGKAAKLEGFQFIGVEREAEYLEIAQARIIRGMD